MKQGEEVRQHAGSGRWLVKTEPDAFSWTQQVERGIEPWTGVRSHQSRSHLLAMREGDLAFFYHSNIGKQIVGVVEVVREAYPDPTVRPDARPGPWVCVDMRAREAFSRPVGLSELKAAPEFADLMLIRQSRLSVVPVSIRHWDRIVRLGGLDG